MTRKKGQQKRPLLLMLSESNYEWLHHQNNMSLCVDNLVTSLRTAREHARVAEPTQASTDQIEEMRVRRAKLLEVRP